MLQQKMKSEEKRFPNRADSGRKVWNVKWIRRKMQGGCPKWLQDPCRIFYIKNHASAEASHRVGILEPTSQKRYRLFLSGIYGTRGFVIFQETNQPTLFLSNFMKSLSFSLPSPIVLDLFWKFLFIWYAGVEFSASATWPRNLDLFGMIQNSLLIGGCAKGEKLQLSWMFPMFGNSGKIPW